MRKCPLAIAFALAIVLSYSPKGYSQTDKTPEAPGLLNSDQTPDLSGVWMQDRPRLSTVLARYWVYELSPDEPPMTAWGEAQFKAAKSSFGARAVPIAETTDPIYHNCTPPGFPRALLHAFPLQIVQVPGEVIVLFEWDSIRHQIFTDGRSHDGSLGPLWMGDAIGHWERDTLVVDTVNFNDKTWLDRVGHPHSNALHVVERIRRTDHDHLVDDITIEDPKAYTKPWTAHVYYLLRPKWTLGEAFCEDGQTFQNFDKSAAAPAK